MANSPELPAQLPGFKIIHEAPSNERKTRPNSGRTKKYAKWLGQRDIYDKATLNKIILANTEDPIDMEELGRSPHFEFKDGFPTYPPAEYRPGEEPPFAPISREEMRILLTRTLPPEMIPFVLDHFVFDFDVAQTGDRTPPGPTVKIKDGKVNITFYRNNFFTDSKPIGHKKVKGERKIIGFIDPRKITFFMGQLIAKMTPMPDKWPDYLRQATFGKGRSKKSRLHLLEPKVNKKKADMLLRRLKGDGKKMALLQLQWEEFVGLAITSPELAQSRFPEAYEHFQNEAKKFNSVKQDGVALKNLMERSRNGVIELKDFNIKVDTRSDEEKLLAEPNKPELSRFDKTIARTNWFLSVFGKKIMYTIPDDPKRASLLAEGDKTIKDILENLTDQEERDAEFGQVMQESKQYDEKARYRALSYLLAASQAGKFAEWRVFAWLTMFSKKFNQTNGRSISENDYKDLELVYSQSEKAGRLGTDVMRYKAVTLGPPEHMANRYVGRRVRVYVLNPNYVEEVNKKIFNKQPRAIFDAIPAVISQFKKGAGFNDIYDTTPEGLMTPEGENVAQYLGRDLSQKLGETMGRMRVEKISPDAKAIATVYFDAYKEMGRHYKGELNRDHFEILQKYASELNRPSAAAIDELNKLNPEKVAKSEDVGFIKTQVEESNKAAEGLKHTLAVALREDSRLMPDTQAYLVDYVVNRGITDPDKLMYALQPVIILLLNNKRTEIEQERRNLFSILYGSKIVRQTLAGFETAKNFREKARPVYTSELEATADMLTDDRGKSILPEAIQEKDLELYKKIGIQFTGEELKSIEEAGTTIETGGAIDSETGEGSDEVNQILNLENENAKNQRRAELLREKVKAAPPEVRRAIVSTMVNDALSALVDNYLAMVGENIDPQTGKLRKGYPSKMAAYQDWRKANGSIFAKSPLGAAERRLNMAIQIAEKSPREGSELQYEALRDIGRAIEYERITAVEDKSKAKDKEPAAEH